MLAPILLCSAVACITPPVGFAVDRRADRSVLRVGGFVFGARVTPTVLEGADVWIVTNLPNCSALPQPPNFHAHYMVGSQLGMLTKVDPESSPTPLGGSCTGVVARIGPVRTIELQNCGHAGAGRVVVEPNGFVSVSDDLRGVVTGLDIRTRVAMLQEVGGRVVEDVRIETPSPSKLDVRVVLAGDHQGFVPSDFIRQVGVLLRHDPDDLVLLGSGVGSVWVQFEVSIDEDHNVNFWLKLALTLGPMVGIAVVVFIVVCTTSSLECCPLVEEEDDESWSPKWGRWSPRHKSPSASPRRSRHSSPRHKSASPVAKKAPAKDSAKDLSPQVTVSAWTSTPENGVAQLPESIREVVEEGDERRDGSVETAPCFSRRDDEHRSDIHTVEMTKDEGDSCVVVASPELTVSPTSYRIVSPASASAGVHLGVRMGFSGEMSPYTEGTGISSISFDVVCLPGMQGRHDAPYTYADPAEISRVPQPRLPVRFSFGEGAQRRSNSAMINGFMSPVSVELAPSASPVPTVEEG
eukprot:Hpha_TRINITY_DN15583_c1_g2::TRINITY_DN15583_c1_g2_i1::g.103973::m.103973